MGLILEAARGRIVLDGQAVDLRHQKPVVTAPTTPLAVHRGWLRAAQIALQSGGFPNIHVFDHVPHAERFPFIVMDQQLVVQMDGAALPGFEHTFYASVWSTYRGQAECWEIMDALWRGLHDRRLLLENGTHVLCQVTDQRCEKDEDGVTYQGSITTRILTHPVGVL